MKGFMLVGTLISNGIGCMLLASAAQFLLIAILQQQKISHKLKIQNEFMRIQTIINHDVRNFNFGSKVEYYKKGKTLYRKEAGVHASGISDQIVSFAADWVNSKLLRVSLTLSPDISREFYAACRNVE